MEVFPLSIFYTSPYMLPYYFVHSKILNNEKCSQISNIYMREIHDQSLNISSVTVSFRITSKKQQQPILKCVLNVAQSHVVKLCVDGAADYACLVKVANWRLALNRNYIHQVALFRHTGFWYAIRMLNCLRIVVWLLNSRYSELLNIVNAQESLSEH